MATKPTSIRFTEETKTSLKELTEMTNQIQQVICEEQGMIYNPVTSVQILETMIKKKHQEVSKLIEEDKKINTEQIENHTRTTKES